MEIHCVGAQKRAGAYLRAGASASAKAEALLFVSRVSHSLVFANESSKEPGR